MQEIADGVLIDTTFRGVTVGAVRTDQGFVLIDAPSFPQDAKHWRHTLQSYADLPIYALVMLDAHRDRMLGPSWFKPELLIAHSSTHETISGLSNSYVSTIATMLTTSTSEQGSLLGGKILKPTVTFNKGLQLHVGNTVLRIMHQPGPARGSIWIHSVDRGVVFVGDSLITDAPPHLNSAHSKDWLEALTYLQNDLNGVIIVPGRGGPTTDRQSAERLVQYLELARERVNSLYETQRTLSDTARVIHELLALFPPPMEHELDEIQQRVRTGLQFIYNEFRERDIATAQMTEPMPLDLDEALDKFVNFDLEDIGEVGEPDDLSEDDEEDDFYDFDEE